MSSALKSAKFAPCKKAPSKIINGLWLPVNAVAPLNLIDALEPGKPEGWTIVTPATFPCNAVEAFNAGTSFNNFSPTVEIEIESLFLFVAPATPVITISSSSSPPSINSTLIIEDAQQFFVDFCSLDN